MIKAITERMNCPDCGGAGEIYFNSAISPGFVKSSDCDRCDCEGVIDWDADTLAANLAIGAALCRAFELGWLGHVANVTEHAGRGWRPGCDRSAP